MNIDLNLKQSFLSATIPGASYLIPIPGALGALEQSHAAIFNLMEVSINAFAFVLLIRLRDLVLVLFGLIHASSFGIRMVKDVLFPEKK